MLLTSGQVSVVISSLVALIFTIALFLSGYILQQQTVRELREIIKPQLTHSKASNFELPWLLEQSTRKGSKYWEARGVVDAVLGEIMDEKRSHEKIKDSANQDTQIMLNLKGATRQPKQQWRESFKGERQSSQPITGAQKNKKPLSRAARRKLIKSQILYDEEKEESDRTRKGKRWRFW